MNLADIPSRGRATQGVIVMRLSARDKVASVSAIMIDPNEIGAPNGAEKETEAPGSSGFFLL